MSGSLLNSMGLLNHPDDGVIAPPYQTISDKKRKENRARLLRFIREYRTADSARARKLWLGISRIVNKGGRL